MAARSKAGSIGDAWLDVAAEQGRRSMGWQSTGTAEHEGGGARGRRSTGVAEHGGDGGWSTGTMAGLPRNAVPAEKAQHPFRRE